MLYNKLLDRSEKLSLIGLGYVGMPIAVAFSQKVNVIGFDINQQKISLYKKGMDPTNEVGNEAISDCTVDFTSDESRLKEAKFHINPGDKVHRLETITKIVSGMDEESLDIIAKVYELVVKAGVHRAESIKIAEAAKVIENSQRDINIAFMNELSIIFNKLDIDTKSVLAAAGTKWNFLKFAPGLVGGHCIGVDPYYLTYRAEQMGYHSQVILAGRRINDDMGKYVVECLIKKMVMAGISIRDARVAILGFTFKENCPDTRNTRVIDIVNELGEYGIKPIVSDPIANEVEALTEYNLKFTAMQEIKNMDAVILAVGHDDFTKLTINDISKLYKQNTESTKVFLDIKGLFSKTDFVDAGYIYWRL